MNSNTLIVMNSGNTVDVEQHGTGLTLVLGNDLGENVRRTALTVDDADALIDRLQVERNRAAAEVKRRITKAVGILAGLGMDPDACRAAIADGAIDPATVLRVYEGSPAPALTNGAAMPADSQPEPTPEVLALSDARARLEIAQCRLANFRAVIEGAERNDHDTVDTDVLRECLDSRPDSTTQPPQFA